MFNLRTSEADGSNEVISGPYDESRDVMIVSGETLSTVYPITEVINVSPISINEDGRGTVIASWFNGEPIITD